MFNPVCSVSFAGAMLVAVGGNPVEPGVIFASPATASKNGVDQYWNVPLTVPPGYMAAPYGTGEPTLPLNPWFEDTAEPQVLHILY